MARYKLRWRKIPKAIGILGLLALQWEDATARIKALIKDDIIAGSFIDGIADLFRLLFKKKR